VLIVLILIVAIIGAVLIAIGAILPRIRTAALVVGVTAVALAMIATALLGGYSQTQRENPAISIGLDTSKSVPILTVKATATSLRSDERMLLRVTTIERRLTNDEVRTFTNDNCKISALTTPSSDAHVRSWTETGADQAGKASTDLTVPLPKKTEYVCAWVILTPRKISETYTTSRQDIAIVDLGGTVPSPKPS
jgi:hypothetical protein